MKLFAVMYLKGKLAAAMFLWPGATVQDCQAINRQYQASLIHNHQVKLSDVKLTCEWHRENPVKAGSRL